MGKKARVESYHISSETGAADAKEMREFFGPTHADVSVRQAVQAVWLMLPKKKRDPAKVEKEFRRLVERAVRDFKQDFDTFKAE